MDVNFKAPETVLTYNPGRTSTVNPGDNAGKATALQRPEASTFENSKEKAQLSRDDVKHITEEMNKFLQMLNADLQFAVHEKTKQLMVQVVDVKEQKVLKEFPPHELLDTIAKIRDYVGFLLDKKV